jgi:hypothetical protein
MDSKGDFLLDIIINRINNTFLENLVTIIIDEYHLILEWENFRDQYIELKKLRIILWGIPFIYLSMILISNYINYIHDILRFSRDIVRFTLSIRWDNINIIISKINETGIQSLLWYFPRLIDTSDHRTIHKIFIFHDIIEPGIDIVNIILKMISEMINDISIIIII